MVDAIVTDDGGLQKMHHVTPLQAPISEEGLPGVDSGVSSIEKSKAVRPDTVPLMEVPLLIAPGSLEGAPSAPIGAVKNPLPPMPLATETFKIEEMKLDMLKVWGASLREISQRVHEINNSPAYLQLHEAQRKRLASSPAPASTSTPSPQPTAEGAVESDPAHFLTLLLDHLQALERVPPTGASDRSAPSQDTPQIMVLPLTAILLASGALAGGVGLAPIFGHAGLAAPETAQPTSSVWEWVQNVQPLFPQLSMPDFIPVINLMVTGPIYYRSWEEATSRTKQERPAYLEVVLKFAEDAMKMIAHPDFVPNLLARLPATGRLSAEERERLASMLKIMLIGVALTLLYSVEVGKIQNNQFGGIEPEELRDLLLGKGLEQPRAGQELGLREMLTLRLVKWARAELMRLPIEDRAQAAGMLVEYVTRSRDLEPMLEPVKVFNEALTPGSAPDAIGIIRV